MQPLQNPPLCCITFQTINTKRVLTTLMNQTVRICKKTTHFFAVVPPSACKARIASPSSYLSYSFFSRCMAFACGIFSMFQQQGRLQPQITCIPRVPQCLSPRRHWDRPLSRVCGHTRERGWGVPFGRLKEKPSTLWLQLSCNSTAVQ
jgi:hypothetical protein